MSKTKEVIVSFIKSFIATFATFAVIAITAVPVDTLFTFEFYQSGGLVSLLGAVLRSTLSEVWKKTLPVSVGGKK